jgi:hypothetical protein
MGNIINNWKKWKNNHILKLKLIILYNIGTEKVIPFIQNV